MPWVVRNYTLTGIVLPTSAHGGVQLWYGTLQTGQYLNSQAYNPRAVFEGAAFDYTSLDRVPIIVSADLKGCAPGQPDDVSLTYWSDHEATRRELAPATRDRGRYMFNLPPPGHDAVIYYYFTSNWPAGAVLGQITTPPLGAAGPFTYFVSQNHLGDLDLYGDLLDVFDLVRLAREAAWDEPLAFAGGLRGAGIRDVGDAVALLAPGREADALLTRVEHDEPRGAHRVPGRLGDRDPSRLGRTHHQRDGHRNLRVRADGRQAIAHGSARRPGAGSRGPMRANWRT